MGFDEDGNYRISAERDEEKSSRPAPEGKTSEAENRPGGLRGRLPGLWSPPVRILLAILVALILAVYSIAVAPGRIRDGKGEMPPAYGRLIRALQFILP